MLIRHLIALACLTACTNAFAASSPNIILMMADDMGIGDTSAYQDWTGNKKPQQVHTPAMETLARRGIRFTDAHSPSSRCTATRQALLTGRYTWRTRLKYQVISAPQGPPLIEPGRPTLGTLLQDQGYRTAMTGKWHCGITYRDANGQPAPTYELSDFRQGIADGPINHGFDFFHGISRSHGTSKFQGWLDGDRVTGATGPLTVDKKQYPFDQVGVVNYQKAIGFLKDHLSGAHQNKPFFIYYASASNHAPHTPAPDINGVPVKGASHPGGNRSDFIYENDVVLDQLNKFLRDTDDPRRPGHKLIDNTLVIFTSDNGAEIPDKTATGPVRSHKGSVYEGGHRVPFIAAWPLGNIGDGNPNSPGLSSDWPIGLTDLFATFAQITGAAMPHDGAEDSHGVLDALRNKAPASRPPLIHHDHKEAHPAKKAPEFACLALRLDNPTVAGRNYPGKWKLFIDHNLLLHGHAAPTELFNLANDLTEQSNLINDPTTALLVKHMTHRLQQIHDRGGVRRVYKD